MKRICLATNNARKIEEIAHILAGRAEIIGLQALGCTEELPETTGTIEGNSRQKAWYVWENYGIDCLADDTGLEVIALNNAPGVDTAYYAGPQRSAKDNIRLLLTNLLGKEDRSARFRTVLTYVTAGLVYQFEGIVHGQIALQAVGDQGFGYDPVFIPEAKGKTFAEMTMDEKNGSSHRARAFAAFYDFFSRQ